VIVSAGEMLVAGPEPHLLVFLGLPTGHDIHAEAARRDRIDRHRHPGYESRRHGQHRHGGEKLDLPRHRGDPGHESERFEIVYPIFAGPVVAAQFNHREREIEPVELRPLYDSPIEIEAGHGLWRGRRHQPAAAADRDEHANLHLRSHRGHIASAMATEARLFISGWIWRPNWSIPSTKSSKASMTPAIAATSSSCAAIVA